MSDIKPGETGAVDNEVRGVFKSAEIAPQRMNSMTNSAVSDVAVERGIEELPVSTPLIVETPSVVAMQATTEVEPTAQIGRSLEDLQASMLRVSEVVQTVEQRQQQIEEAHHKAEEILAEVNRISAALSFDNSLRERINATIARTRRLRNGSDK